MSIATTSLKYGWKVLAILTIGTGTIFVADNVLNRITTKDRIEITLAIVERSLATQTGTNPATYGVDPPSIVRTWTDTNGASVIVTNSIAWRDDLSMKVELDAKIHALCPHYVDTNSVYDGTTNIIMHTFTGLLASLNIGDGTNFTAIPAIGTNAATYGPWAWRNYIVAWQERYKVLEALKVTRDYRSQNVNGSDYSSEGMPFVTDLAGERYSNTISGIKVDAYGSYAQADVLGLENGYDYANDTNYVTIASDFYHKMSYTEFQMWMTWWWIHMTAWWSGPPPYTPYPDGYLTATNLTGLGAGGYWALTKRPYVSAFGSPWEPLAWYWRYAFKANYSTWIFNKEYPGQQVGNTVAIYLKPTLPSWSTQNVTNENGWVWPRSWSIAVEGRFEELIGMPTNVFTKLDEIFVAIDSNVATVVFGSDEFAPLTEAGSILTFPSAPSEGFNRYDNTGSIGTMRGSYVAPDDYFVAKTWTFNYCTNRWW